MTDRFSTYRGGLTAPAEHAFAITPHESNALEEVTRGIWVGTGGNVVCRLVSSGADVSFANVPDGTMLPVRASHVRATSTASGLVGLV